MSLESELDYQYFTNKKRNLLENYSIGKRDV